MFPSLQCDPDQTRSNRETSSDRSRGKGSYGHSCDVHSTDSAGTTLLDRGYIMFPSQDVFLSQQHFHHGVHQHHHCHDHHHHPPHPRPRALRLLFSLRRHRQPGQGARRSLGLDFSRGGRPPRRRMLGLLFLVEEEGGREAQDDFGEPVSQRL